MVLLGDMKLPDYYLYYCPKGQQKYDVNSLSTGAIVGIVVGSVAGVAIIVFCIVFFVIRMKKASGVSGASQDETIYTNQSIK